MASASALTVPLKGWTPIEGDTNQWQDASGQCWIKEKRYNLAFKKLYSQEDANKFGKNLRDALSKSKENGIKIKKVTSQIVKNKDSWLVLAAYSEIRGRETSRVWQLYLSDQGKLRTITGSTHQDEKGSCVNQMREFIRYQAR